MRDMHKSAKQNIKGRNEEAKKENMKEDRMREEREERCVREKGNST